MAVRGQDAEVIGRNDELSMGRAFLGAAAHRFALMAVDGPAGMGKTTIWSALIEEARGRGFTVLTCRPAEAEASYTLAAVRDLLEHVGPAAADGLPAPQRDALAALSAAADPSQPLSEHLVAAALRSLVLVLAEERPVLVAIDDVQWLDPASAAVLAFVARRLRTEPVGLLTARRTGLASALPLDRIDAATQSRVVVGPLSLAALHHVVTQRTGASLPRMALTRVHAAADGNPLFALEIARVLHAQGIPGPGEPLPVPSDVRSMLEQRVAAVQETTGEFLVLAAAVRRPTIAIIGAALARDVEEDVRAATAAGIVVQLAGDELAFAHPLLADAVLSRASAPERSLAHRRLARVARDAEERARHLALSSSGPDETVADALEDAATQADRRGAPAAAAELLEMAVARTPPGDADTIVRRRLAIGAAVLRSGDSARASQLLGDLVRDMPSGPLRAQARMLLASVLMATDTQEAANAQVRASLVDAADDPVILARAHATAARLLEDGEADARIAIDLLDRMPEPDPVALTHAYTGLGAAAMNHGRPIPADLVERALELEARAPLPSVSERFSAAHATWLKYLDDFDGARRLLRQVHQACLDEGDEESLVFAYAHLPQLELWTGNTAAAEEAARRHLELAEATGEEAQRRQAVYNLANVLVQQGHESEARALLADGLQAARGDDDTWTQALLLPVLGILELSVGRPDAAVEALAATDPVRDRAGMPGPGRHLPAFIEALVATGRTAEASTVLADFGRRANPDGRASALAGLHRASAIVAAAGGRLDEAADEIEAALRQHERAPVPFERAWTLLVAGRIRRRRRERAAARDAFEAARAGFIAVDARLWAARAQEELSRTGIRSAPTDLTRTERRVAELVASGMTNREVAATLFISPKTVDANLGRVYRKLGVTSRAELGVRMQALQT